MSNMIFFAKMIRFICEHRKNFQVFSMSMYWSIDTTGSSFMPSCLKIL